MSADDNTKHTPVEDLLYVNQFVLGPRFVDEFPSWQRFKAGSSVFLTVHPLLSVCQVSRGDKTLTLLGYILDPVRPQAGDQKILESLINQLSSCHSFFDRTAIFGGRWVLIVSDGADICLFNDAIGLRQVFYADSDVAGEFWCASQPETIAGLLSLSMDSDAVDFVNSYAFRVNTEFRWPGNSTMYREIKHMIPNHFLDLKSGRCLRYWPHAPLPEVSADKALEGTCRLLRGLMKAASQRFDLALSVTAGLDSRLVLAASREIRDSMAFMTVREISMPEDHPDITTPARLLARLGLKHEIVGSSLLFENGFVEVFKKNVSVPHYVYAPDAQAILAHYGRSRVAVTGSTAEVSRSSFRAHMNSPKNAGITVSDCARLQQTGDHPFALSHYEHWLSGIGELYNVDILNLFEWELDDGNWLAMCQLEFDIAWKDIFTPFNCRELITNLLALDYRHMSPPSFDLHMKMITALWPEVLCVPVNPHKQKKVAFSSRLKARFMRGISRIMW